MKRLLAVVGLFVCTVSAAFAQELSLFAGIDTIPDDAIVLSREEVRRVLAVTDTYTNGMDEYGVRGHNTVVRKAACDASLIPCVDHNDIRTTPFTFLSRFPLFDTLREVREWVVQQARRAGVKIVTQSKAPIDNEGIIGYYGASLPFVVIDSTANSRDDNFFEQAYARFDRSTNSFVRTSDGTPIARAEYPALYNIREAVEVQKLIYASNYYVEGGKPYTLNVGCIGVEESCVYVRGGWQGTSLASPALGATLASLLTVFPEYDVVDLARLTGINGCAKQYPSLPGGGIVDASCMIETICAETDSTSSLCAVEQPNRDPILRSTGSVVGLLENPLPNPDLLYSNVSGLAVISGWVCDAEKVEIEIEGFEQWGTRFTAGYGTSRVDTRGVCGDDDNGFSFLFNWNLLGDGVHTVKAYADGIHFGTARVKVTTLGKEFVRGIPRDVHTGGWTRINGRDVRLEWEEGLQNFIITDGTPIAKNGYRSVSGIRAVLENPSLGSTQSGISAISGWVCDAEKVEIEIEGFEQWRTRFTAGYGTSRIDTRGVCGDDDNGFSFLFNWNLLGDGVHTVNAYADGVQFASTRIKVVTLGVEFLSGYYEKTGLILPDGVGLPQDIHLEWWEGVQNFVMVKVEEYW